ncbi:class I SAM-dependent methyltransferase [Chryseobacterium geocarposphaerae]|uniref:Methyltransferase family protein n=1 Tax=Chryseobacterium geocarposphaerae TaxID=1416776 RepID=A0A2M9C1D3_9FLAO|nr:class I SAM-dependent methyltransferase [Chryseobacterium geocarposphaerae]PJJ64251.1 methyltransferase family protein [Chryseobacterium geocarposphaerae]
MKENNLEEELFCTNFELRNLSDLLVYGKAERWVYGFMLKRYEDEHLNRYLYALQYTSQKKVLDIACGCGYGTFLMAEKGAESVIGVDLSEDAIRYGNHRYARQNLKRFVADATTFNHDYLFDIIVSFETIEHIPDYSGFIENLYRNLSDNGTLLISTPITKTTTTSPQNPYHMIEWNFYDFQNLFKDKFDIVEIMIQEVLIQEESKRKEYNIKNRILNRISKENLKTIKGKSIEKFTGQYNMNQCKEGYQILVLKKKPKQ